jgi:hypothetical protein
MKDAATTAVDEPGSAATRHTLRDKKAKLPTRIEILEYEQRPRRFEIAKRRATAGIGKR